MQSFANAPRLECPSKTGECDVNDGLHNRFFDRILPCDVYDAPSKAQKIKEAYEQKGSIIFREDNKSDMETISDTNEFKEVILETPYQCFENLVLIKLISYLLIHRIILQNNYNEDKRVQHVKNIIDVLNLARQNDRNDLANRFRLAAQLRAIPDRTHIKTSKLYGYTQIICAQTVNKKLMAASSHIKLPVEDVTNASRIAFADSLPGEMSKISLTNLKKVILYSIIFYLIDKLNRNSELEEYRFKHLVEIIKQTNDENIITVKDLLKNLHNIKNQTKFGKKDIFPKMFNKILNKVLMINQELTILLDQLSIEGLKNVIDELIELLPFTLPPSKNLSFFKNKTTDKVKDKAYKNLDIIIQMLDIKNINPNYLAARLIADHGMDTKEISTLRIEDIEFVITTYNALKTDKSEDTLLKSFGVYKNQKNHTIAASKCN